MKQSKNKKIQKGLVLAGRGLGRSISIIVLVVAMGVGAVSYYVYDAYFSAEAGATSSLFYNQQVSAFGCKIRVREGAYSFRVTYFKNKQTANIPYGITVYKSIGIASSQGGSAYWNNTVAQLSATVSANQTAMVKVGNKSRGYSTSAVARLRSC